MPVTWKLSDSEYIPAPEYDTLGTLDNVSLNLPQGVYTTFRTFNKRTRVVGLRGHLDRLWSSAEQSGWAGLIDENLMRIGLRQALSGFPGGECRVRVTLDLTENPGCIYITAEAFMELADDFFTKGVRLGIADTHRTAPEVKSTAFIAKTQSFKNHEDKTIYEWLIVQEGKILEGITSNFFAVKQGRLYTSGGDVLAGITRQIILRLSEEQGIPVVLAPIDLADLKLLQEAFITSSSRGVVPVISIEGQVIGRGVPGEFTRTLQGMYDNYLQSSGELI